jgi:hypothetical protein
MRARFGGVSGVLSAIALSLWDLQERSLVVTAASASRAQIASVPSRVGGRDWRAIVFRGVASLVALLLGLLASQIAFVPWLGAPPATADYIPELHRWHDAFISSFLLILVAGSLLAAIPRPRQTPLPIQFVLLGVGILAIFTLAPLNAPALTIAIITFALIFASYPDTRALLAFPRGERVSLPLLALAAVATVPLLLDAWSNFQLQRTDSSEHATHGHWNGGVAVALTLIVAGYLAASQRKGWQAIGVVTGLAYLYLWAAALAIPNHDGSWGVNGGYVSLVGGVAYVVVTVVIALRARVTRPYEA